MREKRKCTNCRKHLPPETEHYVYEDKPYCTNCIQAKPYTAYIYELNGEYIGDSEQIDNVEFIESYDDYEYEEVLAE